MNDTVSDHQKKDSPDKTENEVPFDAWMIRSCHEYREELYDCESRQGRRYQNYVYGTELDCSQWKTDYENCMKFAYKNDPEAARALIASEEQRRQYRLKCARANDIWAYRKTPPEDWNAPLRSQSEAEQTMASQSEAGQNEHSQRETTMETIKSKCAVS